MEIVEELEAEPLNDFDDILEAVGSNGRFQKTLLYGMLGPLCILYPYFFSNRIFMLSVPNHWCHVGGKPNSMDLEEWKNLTLPMEIGSDGLSRFSQCEMLNLGDFLNETNSVKCNTWDYDRSNYERTLATEFSWVCDKEYYVANVFAMSGAGATFGTIVLGIAVDKFGRKSTYFSTLLCFIFFSSTSLLVPGNINVFLVVQFMLGLSMTLILLSPSMIAMELLGKEHRAWVFSITGVAYVLGNSLLPLFAYLLRSWFLIGLMTPISAILIFGYYKLLPESPRWLLSMGRTEEAVEIMEKISIINGKLFKKGELRGAFKAIVAKNEEDSNIGNARVWHLFSRRTLAVRTILLGIICSINGVIYGGLVLNVTNMAGNEFLNYFLLGIMELPVGWVAGYLANKYGRRWTKSALFLLLALVFFIATIFGASRPWVAVAAAMSGTFILATNSTIFALHQTELFPTQLRSTGSSLVTTVASVVGFSAPYIVQLGKSNTTAPYVIYTVACILGAIVSPSLPESLGRKLPETLQDADTVGKNHKFWSFLPK